MTEAHIISAFMQGDGGHKPVVGVLFGIVPNARALRAMGFLKVQSTERVTANGDAPQEPTLFVFDRSPAANEVTISRITGNGAIVGQETRTGEPHSIIPEVQGTAVLRFITPRNGLCIIDLKGRVPVAIEKRRVRC